jgi:hypothetical protein
MKLLFVAGFGIAAPQAWSRGAQTVARLLSPEGILVGVTVTPWMREGGGH